MILHSVFVLQSTAPGDINDGTFFSLLQVYHWLTVLVRPHGIAHRISPLLSRYLISVLITRQIIRACKDASARRITAVLPNYPYARQ